MLQRYNDIMYLYMKRIVVVLIIVLIVNLNLRDAMAQGNAIKATTGNSFGWGIFFVVYIPILLLLALWILKNSNILSNTVDTPELDGNEWLNTHIKNLDTRELDKLINSGNVKRREKNSNLLNHKN
ncbi:MAG TPA: hypothetical protein VIJ27_09870 [Mucilaginibacter sp.]